MVIEDTKTIISNLSRAHTSQGPRRNDIEKLTKTTQPTLTNAEKLSKLEQQQKLMKQYKGQFFFPRRQRFNEDVDQEIFSQRSNHSANKHFTPLVKKNADLDNEYSTLGS
jgi:hypothetical protein